MSWSWFARLFRRIELDPGVKRCLANWRARPTDDPETPFAEARYVVVDVESTGLDLTRDRLIAIGAVAVRGGRIELADGFETILRQEEVSAKENILVHGIGSEAQREGTPPAEALLDFLDYLGKSPLVAFHVGFDATMIRRACRDHLGLDFKHPWLDLAYLMPALLPDYARRHHSLDQWTEHFGIGNYARHNALADALATAELCLVALSLAAGRGARHYKALKDLEKAQRWLSRMDEPAWA